MEDPSLLALRSYSLLSHLLNLTCWQSALWCGPHACDVLAVETPGDIVFAAATHTMDV